MISSTPVSRALLLFSAAMASSLVFAAFRGELGLTDILYSRLHFGMFWGASILSTWWGTAVGPGALRWAARLAAVTAAASTLVPMSSLLSVPSHALIAQDAPTLLWATLFSSALALAIAPASAFFGRCWWFLVGYRLVLHAAMWGEALSFWSLGTWYPLLSAAAQAILLVLAAFSWITLRFPESPSAPA